MAVLRGRPILCSGKETPMLKSCQYCGHIHDSKTACPQKIRAQQIRWRKSGSPIDRFRGSARWKDMSLYIRRRDRFLCLACLFDIDGTGSRITTASLSVHHITPVAEDWDRRLDASNLITLCEEHHERAEDGSIDRNLLYDLLNRSIDRLYDTPRP